MADLDIIQLLRRKRMHGFGLHFMLGRHDRANAARMAFSRPLLSNAERLENQVDPTNSNTIGDKWYHIEGLNQRDMFMIAFFKRYGKIVFNMIDKPREKEIKERIKSQLLATMTGQETIKKEMSKSESKAVVNMFSKMAAGKN
jgi:hypothetical protein